jgi:hypothetical protein
VSVDPSRLLPGVRVLLPGTADEVTILTVVPGPFYDLVYEGVGGISRITLCKC